jgi:hypothetical protein
MVQSGNSVVLFHVVLAMAVVIVVGDALHVGGGRDLMY